jgi:hypothetical protein
MAKQPASQPAAGGATSAPQAIEAIVEPIRAGGALLGFAVGAYATRAAGGAFADCVIHGLVGAALVMPIAWFFALFIVRESIRGNVEQQRRDYDAKVEEARRAVAVKLRDSGMPLSPALQQALRNELPPGRG